MYAHGEADVQNPDGSATAVQNAALPTWPAATISGQVGGLQMMTSVPGTGGDDQNKGQRIE
jgi:hypothetical protein